MSHVHVVKKLCKVQRADTADQQQKQVERFTIFNCYELTNLLMMEENYEEVENGLVPLRNNFLLPTSKLDDQKFEFYFLLDVSGSMHGAPSELASRALQLFLQSLPEDCYFNILAFDENFKSVFPTSVKYSQESLDEAKRAIPGLWSFGYDDDIHTPLQFIYNSRQISGYLTQIFIITDGCVQSCQVGSVSWTDILNLVKSKVKHSRAFSLGIGGGVNHAFIKGIGDNSGGLAEFVGVSDMIESKILNMLKVSLRPAVLKPIRDVGAARLYQLSDE